MSGYACIHSVFTYWFKNFSCNRWGYSFENLHFVRFYTESPSSLNSNYHPLCILIMPLSLAAGSTKGILIVTVMRITRKRGRPVKTVVIMWQKYVQKTYTFLFISFITFFDVLKSVPSSHAMLRVTVRLRAGYKNSWLICEWLLPISFLHWFSHNIHCPSKKTKSPSWFN